jgi:hypothetical protein
VRDQHNHNDHSDEHDKRIQPPLLILPPHFVA